MAPIVAITDALAELGITAGTAAATDVARINGAISGEIRRICRREFEGAQTAYTETMRIRRMWEFNLPHTPVAEIDSITRVYLDGSADEPYTSDSYMLEDSETGLVRLGVYFGPRAWATDVAPNDGSSRFPLGAPDYVSVAWKTTGEIPAPITLASIQWLKARWANWDGRWDLMQYKTGEDMERYDPALVGVMPHDVARALALYHHSTGGGVV